MLWCPRYILWGRATILYPFHHALADTTPRLSGADHIHLIMHWRIQPAPDSRGPYPFHHALADTIPRLAGADCIHLIMHWRIQLRSL